MSGQANPVNARALRLVRSRGRDRSNIGKSGDGWADASDGWRDCSRAAVGGTGSAPFVIARRHCYCLRFLANVRTPPRCSIPLSEGPVIKMLIQRDVFGEEVSRIIEGHKESETRTTAENRGSALPLGI